jgi:dUTP pyrophosphatase
MKNVLIQFNKTHIDAVLPVANNADKGTGDTGYDLTAVDEAIIPAGHSKVVPVGLKLAYITPGFWFRIEPRSGLGFKHSIQPHLGVIDNGYKGDLGVKLYNLHPCSQVMIRPGDRIAQLVVYELIQPHMSFTENSYESERGESGFGSSG